MPYDDEERDAENRKLEALTAISMAIGMLGKSLAAVVEQSSSQGQRLDKIDRKLDRLLELSQPRSIT